MDHWNMTTPYLGIALEKEIIRDFVFTTKPEQF